MKEIKVYLNLYELKDKVKKYLPRVDGGYYFEIFLASKRVITKPFRVSNEKNSVQINQNIFITNQCGSSIDFWLKTYKDDQFIASGEIVLSEVKNGEDNEVEIVVESALFATLRLQIEVQEQIIEKVEKIVLDEEFLKKEVIDYEELERIKREEERLKREEEELEALKQAQAKKTIITVSDFKRDNEAYF